MKMLTKFESKSSKAKGVAFHPKRPWILVSLHSSTIQLWDYRMGTLIDRFEDHDGPVRGVDFHPTQPYFVSGGDDYSIKVWSLQTRKCLFTLSGHLDYVRTVFFHYDLPWIVSASDDQTIRIWNWQNRQEIACLTGHNHYVMSAKFHPSEDLIVSASLDQTVRVWDITGLRKKHSAPANMRNTYEDQFARQNMPQQDIFGNTDAMVKYVLEGHDKGVNWADFHPTLPLIVSGADDRLVKIWRMSEHKAWEVDTCRGHTNNVPCVLFHPTQDLIISVGEDKTIRTWDLNKRTPVKQFKRDNDRFWLIAAHPEINLFATCHDSGVMVFKLDRERPAHSVHQDSLYFINNEKQVQVYDYRTKKVSLPMLSLKKIGKPWTNFKTLSYNPAEHSILITTGDADNAYYALVSLPKDVTGAIEPTNIREGTANFACFIARNRFVTYVKSTKTLEVLDLNNSVTKSIKLDYTVKDVVYAGPGTVLLLRSNSVIHYDVQQRKELAEIQVNNVKYVSWSADSRYVALLSKHTITIATRKLELVTSMHETIRIKSAEWDESGVLIYSTLNHIKYTLLNGDNGIIKTLASTLYITKVQGRSCFCLNRNGEVEVATIDPTEYRFKKALVNKNFTEVLRIIKNSNLVGQNIIGYLQKKGYPEIALQFVQDPQTRFELSLECGNLDIALEEAKKLNNAVPWSKLGREALGQCNVKIVELVFQQLKQLDRLSFFYLITGDVTKLSKMLQISEHRGDLSAIVQNSIYLNDIEKRIKAYLEGGLAPLAYATAKSNGLDELASQIAESSGIAEADIKLPFTEKKSVSLPQVKIPNVNDWPLKQAQLSFFEQAILGQVDALELKDEYQEEARLETAPVDSFGEIDFEDAQDLEEDDGWDLGDEDLDVDIDEVEETLDSEDVPIVAGEVGNWLKNGRTAAVYAAAGQFDRAAQILNKQVGVVEFEPLRERFLDVYQASKLYLAGNQGLDPIPSFIRADTEEDSASEVLPFIPGLDTLEFRLQEGFKLFRAAKLQQAIEEFRSIIYTVVLSTVKTQEEEEKLFQVLQTCREYILGLSIELARRQLSQDQVKRSLELAAYFTRAKLQPAHRVSALQVAMTQSFKHKNFISASYFSGEFLKLVTSGTRAEQAQKIKLKSDQIANDSIEIDFDPYAEFDICAGTFTPIYKGSRFASESLVGAKYQVSEEGKLCSITKITQIGATSSGLRLFN
ncbi:coatomer subunit alpha [Komagataella kurtzmanii]|nr:coatomer subunit alpha [Komagataella kurtzmanii]